MITDPFAALDLPKQPSTTHLYISSRLTLLRVPNWMNPGLWVRFPDNPTHTAWHRRLNAHAFLSLRAAVERTIEAGKLPEEFSDATERLERIAEIGIEAGAFTADDIAPGRAAPESFSFTAGLPRWADDIGSDFLPPQQQKKPQPRKGSWPRPVGQVR